MNLSPLKSVKRRWNRCMKKTLGSGNVHLYFRFGRINLPAFISLIVAISPVPMVLNLASFQFTDRQNLTADFRESHVTARFLSASRGYRGSVRLIPCILSISLFQTLSALKDVETTSRATCETRFWSPQFAISIFVVVYTADAGPDRFHAQQDLGLPKDNARVADPGFVCSEQSHRDKNDSLQNSKFYRPQLHLHSVPGMGTGGPVPW